MLFISEWALGLLVINIFFLINSTHFCGNKMGIVPIVRDILLVSKWIYLVRNLLNFHIELRVTSFMYPFMTQKCQLWSK